MKRKVTREDWLRFLASLNSIIHQCDRMRAEARGQGRDKHSAADVSEMHDRFEKAAASFLGERRRFWETREGFLGRVAGICGKPAKMLEVMSRNGIEIAAS